MLAELRAFLLVVDEGSFFSAANSAGVSRTTLRRQVDALEARAGAKLLLRTRNGIELTDAGKRLAKAGRAMERDFDAVLVAVRETAEGAQGEVRAHLAVGFHPGAMAAVFAMIRANWPGVRVRATFSDAPDLGRLTDVDLVVWFGEPAPSKAWVEKTALVTRQRLLAHPDYLARRGTPKTVADLQRHEVLAWLAPGETDARLTLTGGASVPIAAALVTSNAHFVHESAHLGAGIAWAPDGDLPVAPERKPLVRLLEEAVGRDVPLRIAAPRAIAALPKMQIFLEHLEALSAVPFRS